MIHRSYLSKLLEYISSFSLTESGQAITQKRTAFSLNAIVDEILSDDCYG
jgi:hypothetical protein